MDENNFEVYSFFNIPISSVIKDEEKANIIKEEFDAIVTKYLFSSNISGVWAREDREIYLPNEEIFNGTVYDSKRKKQKSLICMDEDNDYQFTIFFDYDKSFCDRRFIVNDMKNGSHIEFYSKKVKGCYQMLVSEISEVEGKSRLKELAYYFNDNNTSNKYSGEICYTESNITIDNLLSFIFSYENPNYDKLNFSGKFLNRKFNGAKIDKIKDYSFLVGNEANQRNVAINKKQLVTDKTIFALVEEFKEDIKTREEELNKVPTGLLESLKYAMGNPNYPNLTNDIVDDFIEKQKIIS